MWRVNNGGYRYQYGSYTASIASQDNAWHWTVHDTQRPVMHSGTCQSADEARISAEEQLNALIHSDGVTFTLLHHPVPVGVHGEHVSGSRLWEFFNELGAKEFGRSPQRKLCTVKVGSVESQFKYLHASA